MVHLTTAMPATTDVVASTCLTKHLCPEYRAPYVSDHNTHDLIQPRPYYGRTCSAYALPPRFGQGSTMSSSSIFAPIRGRPDARVERDRPGHVGVTLHPEQRIRTRIGQHSG